MSSFGAPGFALSNKVAPPQRGSFPLDHDGECKAFMLAYLKCLKIHGSNNGECRLESKRYLECRMDNGLMTRDDMANLGLGDVVDPESSSTKTASSTPNSTTQSSTPPTEELTTRI
ncbi:hypothetical protein CI109_106108 [Kwoniella shandongensis]|uniref:CHCH domain-containing protein n=1 Tax=Kwoniella shandongensis TaxID=1734106 RepID=A0AAJ8LPF8_9TREE